MKTALEKYRKELESIKEAGTWKGERIITTPQRSRIDTTAAILIVLFMPDIQVNCCKNHPVSAKRRMSEHTFNHNRRNHKKSAANQCLYFSHRKLPQYFDSKITLQCKTNKPPPAKILKCLWQNGRKQFKKHRQTGNGICKNN